MARASAFPLVAVDIGNSRVKLATFAVPLAEPLPSPDRTATFDLEWSDAEMAGWLEGKVADYAWTIASVNRPVANRLVEWLGSRGVAPVRLLTYTDLPLVVDMPKPESVGIDRLVASVAANKLRAPDEPAIVVTHGSAITVNLIDNRGSFVGGAIMPGVHMTARALHEFTDRLPLVEVTEAPAVLERSTEGAIRFGLYWGVVGAAREVIARLSPSNKPAQVFLTGGGAPALAAILGEGYPRPPQLVPHLTLAGVALAAAHLSKAAP
jgi:type III pantothenate kinase